jgi:hypothetical protein
MVKFSLRSVTGEACERRIFLIAWGEEAVWRCKVFGDARLSMKNNLSAAASSATVHLDGDSEGPNALNSGRLR